MALVIAQLCHSMYKCDKWRITNVNISSMCHGYRLTHVVYYQLNNVQV